ncbi:MAG: NAD(P)/FAD-dependent oxidoreductase [SAR202 cluster bacterium]|nr:NAD(P)/FAD-dependent oxidoreductase [SAR202 cluster bacterium]
MSTVARSLGLASRRDTVVAIGGEVAATALARDLVEVYIEPEFTRGWFGWLIPSGIEGVSRIGVGLGERGSSPRRLLQPMMARHAHLSDRAFMRLQGGVIPVAPPRHIVAERVMLVGDAAGSAKPTSGGGIFTGILSAKIAASTALGALQRDDCSYEALQPYEAAWATEVRRELLLGQALRHLLMQLTPKQIDEMLGLLELPKIRELVLAEGDIDFPARLFSRLLGSRSLVRSLVALRPSAWVALVTLAWRWRRATRAMPRASVTGVVAGQGRPVEPARGSPPTPQEPRA